MFDIHTHVLPLVDDGSGSVETSLNMLRFMVENGVTDVVLTPHYRGKYNKTAKELKSLFNQFKKQVLDAGINVNLYIGQEVFRTEDLIGLVESKKVLTLNDTNYVLLDTAPILQVSDFIHISKVSDGVLLLVAYGKTTRQQLVGAVKELKNGNIPILGTVFTMYDKKYDASYNDYGKYYGEEYADIPKEK